MNNVSTRKLLKRFKPVVWDLTGEREERIDKVIKYLQNRLNRHLVKSTNVINLTFIQALKMGYIRQATNKWWIVDVCGCKKRTVHEALSILNEHLNKQSN
ncbi:hypersensitive-induced response protein 4 [Proteus phage 309]|uniref:Hypersensitive-induced response protein 4 n=1 Tax=Proteus phage 309 TaxID=2894355 RepID=A0AAE8YHL6_9CAUD|nr:hypersensitive-induced response protein 4 [Proteus phage 309]